MDTKIWARNASRFFALVDVRARTECWPWKGKISRHHNTGLFRMVVEGKPTSQMAHYIASYVLHFGPKERRMRIMARCKNHLCCNPEHLYATESRSPQKRTDTRTYDQHLIDKFWSKVQRGGDDECWLWIGLLAEFGHGIFCRSKGKRKTESAHRFIYYHTFPNTDPAAHICHHCDVPACVNINHLYAGSAKTNVHDCINRRRRYTSRGEGHPTARLTEEQVRSIRKAAKEGPINQAALARKYCVTDSAINAIIFRRTWAHLSE